LRGAVGDVPLVKDLEELIPLRIFDIILSQLNLLNIPTTHFPSGPENKQWDTIHKNSTARILWSVQQ
jgi:hypothetical protein